MKIHTTGRNGVEEDGKTWHFQNGPPLTPTIGRRSLHLVSQSLKSVFPPSPCPPPPPWKYYNPKNWLRAQLICELACVYSAKFFPPFTAALVLWTLSFSLPEKNFLCPHSGLSLKYFLGMSRTWMSPDTWKVTEQTGTGSASEWKWSSNNLYLLIVDY